LDIRRDLAANGNPNPTYEDMYREAQRRGLIPTEAPGGVQQTTTGTMSVGDSAQGGSTNGGYEWATMQEALLDPLAAAGKNPNMLADSIKFAIWANAKYPGADLPILSLDATIYEIAQVNEMYLAPFAHPDTTHVPSAWENFLNDPITIRTLGGVQMVGSAIGAVVTGTAAVATSETGVGAVAFGAVTLIELDSLQAGARQMWTGRYEAPVGVQLMERAGVSPVVANITYAVPSLAGGFAAPLAMQGQLARGASVTSRTAVAAEKARVAGSAAIDASASTSEALAANVFHVTTNPRAAPSILNGIDPQYLNSNARFGAAFYVTEVPETALAEVAHYGAEPLMGIRFSTNGEAANVLDLTNPNVAAAWGYQGGAITPMTQSIGTGALDQGFNVIRYFSERAPGAVNYAILDDFNELLVPVAISPAKP